MNAHTSDITDRTVLITGATDGLGRALAGRLAAAGASVLIHGRDPERLQDTEREIRARTPGARLRLLQANLASLREVEDLADSVLALDGDLDVLVNNAGIGSDLPGEGRRLQSEDGLELRFAVNYLAGYRLTGRLLERLSSRAYARVVNVASAGQMPIDFDDVMLVREYSGVRAYCQSKLAQIMHSIDLAERLQPARPTVNALHPATYMPTKMVLSAGVRPASTLQEGVAATERLVVDPSLDRVSGRYFNGQSEARAHPQAYDPAARGRLRELSERLIAETLGRR